MSMLIAGPAHHAASPARLCHTIMGNTKIFDCSFWALQLKEVPGDCLRSTFEAVAV